MRNLFLLAIATLLLYSCKEDNSKHEKTSTSRTLPVLPYPLIPKDTGNKMITSYLNSIDYLHNDSDIQSLVINAKDLRLYLDSLETTNPVVQMKIMFAHTLDYINNGNNSLNAGYKRNALTVVLIGVNANGDYVYFPETTAYDKSMPCPTSCPNGNASSPFLQ